MKGQSNCIVVAHNSNRLTLTNSSLIYCQSVSNKTSTSGGNGGEVARKSKVTGEKLGFSFRVRCDAMKPINYCPCLSILLSLQFPVTASRFEADWTGLIVAARGDEGQE